MNFRLALFISVPPETACHKHSLPCVSPTRLLQDIDSRSLASDLMPCFLRGGARNDRQLSPYSATNTRTAAQVCCEGWFGTEARFEGGKSFCREVLQKFEVVRGPGLAD